MIIWIVQTFQSVFYCNYLLLCAQCDEYRQQHCYQKNKSCGVVDTLYLACFFLIHSPYTFCCLSCVGKGIKTLLRNRYVGNKKMLSNRFVVRLLCCLFVS